MRSSLDSQAVAGVMHSKQICVGIAFASSTSCPTKWATPTARGEPRLRPSWPPSDLLRELLVDSSTSLVPWPETRSSWFVIIVSSGGGNRWTARCLFMSVFAAVRIESKQAGHCGIVVSQQR